MPAPANDTDRASDHLAAIRATLAAASPPDPGRRLPASELARMRRRFTITEPEPFTSAQRGHVPAGPDSAGDQVDTSGAPEPGPGAHGHECAGCGAPLRCPFAGDDPERCPLTTRAVPARCRGCGPPTEDLDEGRTP